MEISQRNVDIDMDVNLVIFGATGDLMHEKLIPAVNALLVHDQIGSQSQIIAVGRRELTTEEYKAEACKKLPENFESKLIWGHLTYVYIDFHDPMSYEKIYQAITNHTLDKVFYLATPPTLFPIIAWGLHESDLIEKGNAHHRIVFEKPYGVDLDHSEEINQDMYIYFKEAQIYRIDHYLGKEMIQALFAVRFANKMFEHIWNHESIDSVYIIAKESINVKTRGPYYDKVGALKDMVQSHLLQMAALVAMDEPKSMNADDIRDEKVKVLKDFHIPTESIVFGQYEGYNQTEGIDPNTQTETAVYFHASLNSERFKNTKFHFITGKSLSEKRSEIVIKFKPHSKEKAFFNETVLFPNELRIKVAPVEGVSIQFNVKKPGLENEIIPKNLDYYHHEDATGNIPEAYEKLLHEVCLGSPTLFTRWDEIYTSWKIIDHIKAHAKTPLPYKDSQTFEALLEAKNLEVDRDLRRINGHHF